MEKPPAQHLPPSWERWALLENLNWEVKSGGVGWWWVGQGEGKENYRCGFFLWKQREPRRGQGTAIRLGIVTNISRSHKSWLILPILPEGSSWRGGEPKEREVASWDWPCDGWGPACLLLCPTSFSSTPACSWFCPCLNPSRHGKLTYIQSRLFPQVHLCMFRKASFSPSPNLLPSSFIQ